MSTILLEAPPLTKEDLDIPLENDKDETTLAKFEDAWKKYLEAHPLPLPYANEQRITEMSTEINQIQSQRQLVEAELKNQLSFLAQAKESSEFDLKSTMAAAARSQQIIHKDLNRNIDIVAVATHNLNLNQPWERFLAGLDQAVVHHAGMDEEESKSNGADIDDQSYSGHAGTHKSSTTAESKAMQPSARALFLAKRSNYDGTFLEGPNEVSSSEFMARAYAIDQSLMKAQRKVIQREIERYEKTTESLGVLGAFFAEQTDAKSTQKKPSE